MEKYRLEDCCEILDSKRIPITAKDRIAGEYPYYGANGVQDYVADYIFDDELVLLAEDGGNFGSKERPIAYRVSGKCWVNNHAHVLKAKEMLDTDYLCYSLMFYDVGNMVNGATRQKLNQSQMRQMLIPKRSLAEQKKIVNQLNSIVAIKEKRRQQIDLLDTLIKSRFVEMFGDQSDNPNEYPVIRFEEVVEYMGDIGSNGANAVISANLDMKDDEDYALMVRFLNFTQNDFTDNVKYITEEAYNFFKKSKVYGGELIFCKIGSAGLNYIMPNLQRPVSLGLNQIMVRLNNKINTVYLYNMLNMKYGKNLIDGCINGAVTKSITKTAMKKIPVMYPPMELQIQYAEFVKQINKLKIKVQTSLDQMQLLFDSLMQEYFE